MITGWLDEVKGWMLAQFASIHFPQIDPLWAWYGYGLVFFAIICVIAFFLPFQWVRAGLGALLLLAGAFIAGGRTMHNEMKDEIAKAKKPKPAIIPPKPDHSFFSW